MAGKNCYSQRAAVNVLQPVYSNLPNLLQQPTILPPSPWLCKPPSSLQRLLPVLPRTVSLLVPPSPRRLFKPAPNSFLHIGSASLLPTACPGLRHHSPASLGSSRTSFPLVCTPNNLNVPSGPWSSSLLPVDCFW